MRIAVAWIALLVSAGCQSDRPSPDPVIAQLNAQSEKIDALEKQLKAAQDQIAAQPAQPLLSVFHVETDQGAWQHRFQLSTISSPSKANFYYLHVLELTTGRFVTMSFDVGKAELEFVAGRDVRQDLKAGVPRRPQSSASQPGESAPGNPSNPPTFRHHPVVIIVDDANQRLLVYKLDTAQNKLALVVTDDLAKVFNLKRITVSPP